MRFKKIYSIVMENFINGYGLIEKNVRGLEEQKEEDNIKDINSFIKSKNKVNKSVESQVLKNIIIDDNISTLLKWKEVIDSVFEEFKKEDEEKGKIIDYKLFTNFSEGVISEVCDIGIKKVNRTIRDFVTEVIIIAIEENLINVKKVC